MLPFVRLSTLPRNLSFHRGFSLLEVTISMAISGILLGSIWQLLATTGQKAEATALASQALSVSSAAKSYISGQSSTLLALPGLASLGSVARVKITDTDTGDTANSVQGAGYLPQSFVNLNSFGQSYALFVRREDAGTMGVADTGDRVIGLLVTTGGATISDGMGAQIAKGMGAPGGFLYADSNPDAPSAATTAHGAYGGWQIDLSAAGWSSISTVATEGHIAALVNLLPSGSGGGGGGASEIDDLDDGATDYANANMFMGQDAGDAVTSGTFNTGVGHSALKAVSSASNNTAFGAYALKAQTTGSGANSAFGVNALAANTTGAYNTAFGSTALLANTTGGQNTAIGGAALATAATPSYNTAVGYTAMQMTTTGGQNTAIGHQALRLNTTGSNNTALGFSAGGNITTGGSNIIIGSSVDAPVATASNQLNIGNTIYGDLSTDSINIGSATIVSGISLDVGSKTDTFRPASGTTAQRPTCSASLRGAQRWNTSTNTLEMCDSANWVVPVLVSTGGAQAPQPTPGSGYLVLTESTWDGNMGGLAGAAAKCLTELTTKTNWMYYATANAAGQLVAGKVQALMCGSFTNCSPPLALTTYYFARVGDATVGGASFTSNADQSITVGSAVFSAPNYFGGVYDYYTGLSTESSTIIYATSAYASTSASCSNWTSNTSTVTSPQPAVGFSNQAGSGRYAANSGVCSDARRLICMVHP